MGGGGRDGRIGRWSRTLLAYKNRCGVRRIRRRTGWFCSLRPFGRFSDTGSVVWAGPAERTQLIAHSRTGDTNGLTMFKRLSAQPYQFDSFFINIGKSPLNILVIEVQFTSAIE